MKNSHLVFFFSFFCDAVHQGHSILSNSHYTLELCQVGEKVDKVQSWSDAAGSAQFYSIALTATIKTEALPTSRCSVDALVF